MAESRLTVRTNDLTITIESESPVTTQEAVMKALVELIWSIEPDRDDYHSIHGAYDRVLTALGSHYARDWPNGDEVPLRQVLEAMVRECAERPGTALNDPFEFDDLSDSDPQ